MKGTLISSINKLQKCYLIKLYLQNCFYPRTIMVTVNRRKPIVGRPATNDRPWIDLNSR